MKTWFITGTSRGFGREWAIAALDRGDQVAATARNLGTLDDRVTKYGDAILPIKLDVTDREAAFAAVRQAHERFGRLDVVVNNAGYGMVGPFHGTKGSDQIGMIDLNVRALVELTHVYWPKMLANKRGGVLNVASVGAFQPGPLMAIYYASKAFVLSFSEALWKEAEGTGVHVSCLCPGPTESNFRARAGTGKTRLKNLGTPMSAAVVAKQGYRGFQRNTRVVINGLRNRMLARAVPFLPRKTLLDIVYNLQSPA